MIPTRVLLALLLTGCSTEWVPVDQDGDGVSRQDGDCWDAIEGPEGSSLQGADIYPGATETWYDGVDQDCGGNDDYDADGDGWVPTDKGGMATLGVPSSGQLPAGDCWDDPAEIPADMLVVTGSDSQGQPLSWQQPNAPQVNPESDDAWYDGVDQDCQGDDDFDQDQDGWATSTYPDQQGSYGEDCDDEDADVHPGASDTWYDGVDTDCDGWDDDDADRDGYTADDRGGDDCDDDNADIHPGASEVWYNGLDESCDGNDGDQDEDGFWIEDYAQHVAASGTGNPPLDIPSGDGEGDCDDTNADAHPGAEEIFYDGVDGDCQGGDDYDADGDGYRSEDYGGRDCDDADSGVFPEAVEYCNSGDDDCDGLVDEDAADASTWYSDADMDGYGDPDSAQRVCSMPAGAVANGDDCDDSDNQVHPGALDTWYDGLDSDCDGASDYDADGDGHDAADFGGDDCDDGDAMINPGLAEICGDGLDNDCDEATDQACGPAGQVSLADAEVFLYGSAGAESAGYSVAGAGDINADGLMDVLVGAPDWDDPATDAGVAYLFLGPLTTGGMETADARLLGDDSSDHLGWSLAGAGDVNGDGWADLLVGAYGDSTGSSNAGAAYLLLGPVSGDVAASSADATLYSLSSDDQAGYAVSGAGDANRDRVDDLLIGAPYQDDGASDAGAVYLFNGPVLGSNPLDNADARFLGSRADDHGGAALAGGHDANGDGYADVLIGAWGEDSMGSEAGATYLLLGPFTGDKALDTADAIWFGESSGDYAGLAVAWLGDMDADGYPDALVGAPGEDSGGDDAGAAYLFGGEETGTMVLTDAKASFLGDYSYDLLGTAVSSAGDFNADGEPDCLLSAPWADIGASDGGAIYLFLGPVTGQVDASSAPIILYGENADDLAGTSIASAGDTDGDGNDDILVGAPGQDSGAGDAGAAYLQLGALGL